MTTPPKADSRWARYTFLWWLAGATIMSTAVILTASPAPPAPQHTAVQTQLSPLFADEDI